MRRSIPLLLVLAFLILPDAALATSDLHAAAESMGRDLGWPWAVPFALLLCSIAVLPLWTPHFWEHHFGKVAAFWSLCFLAPFAAARGLELAAYVLAHIVIVDYIPFIILLFALFTIAGGVRLTGTLVGRPLTNIGLMCLGTFLASWMGTTGAAMLCIRPLLRANAHRRYRTHTVVFFIFLVANIGGALTPLGDPPLFLGYLHGVDFFWPTLHLWGPTLMAALSLLGIYYVLDSRLYAKEGSPAPPHRDGEARLGLEGWHNLFYLAGVVGAILFSGAWRTDAGFTVYHVKVEAPGLARDLVLLALAGLSLKTTREETRRGNEFSWSPIKEVAKLFAGIFVTMIPALAILRAGKDGALSGLIALVTRDGKPVDAMYFWLTGALSSFLDNAPTYLVFFNTAGGDADRLMTNMTTLMAISAGAVFMGANTYIGNAPNFMVRSIAESAGVKMPSFFGYMLWSAGILIPSFLLVTWAFFR